MRFLAIERFRSPDAVPATYERLREHGRMLPQGIELVESWVEANLERRFVSVECMDATRLQEWIARWLDLIDFEIVPVVASAEAARVATETQ